MQLSTCSGHAGERCVGDEDWCTISAILTLDWKWGHAVTGDLSLLCGEVGTGKCSMSLVASSASGLDGSWKWLPWQSGDRGVFGLDWTPAGAGVDETLEGCRDKTVCPEVFVDATDPLGFRGGARPLPSLLFFNGTGDSEQCRTEDGFL